MSGEIGILNVGAGDTKLVFDKSNPAEVIRSARIVRDMIRRGYALLVEVDDGKGGKVFTRAYDFREDTCEYIIADLDPVPATHEPREENRDAEAQRSETSTAGAEGSKEPAPPEKPRRGRRPKLKAVAATAATGIAVARSAGG